jgi:hypothetical protein
VDADGKQQAVVFRVDKGDIRGVLAGLEAPVAALNIRTKKRKAGKG